VSLHCISTHQGRNLIASLSLVPKSFLTADSIAIACPPSYRADPPGMILMDHVKLIPQASQELQKWVEEGKIDVTEGETVVDTKFEDVPKTFQLLFTGGNKGKLVTKLV
jgi:NADPH-dependent curcumin reductase CurA